MGKYVENQTIPIIIAKINKIYEKYHENISKYQNIFKYFKIFPYYFLHLQYSYETSDGQTRYETGYLRDDPNLGKILTVRGSYSYINDEGQQYLVRYTADENGYKEETGPLPPSQAPLPPRVIASLLG